MVQVSKFKISGYKVKIQDQLQQQHIVNYIQNWYHLQQHQKTEYQGISLTKDVTKLIHVTKGKQYPRKWKKTTEEKEKGRPHSWI